MLKPSHTPLGEHLITLGYISRNTLNTLLQRSNKKRLGERLVHAKMLPSYAIYRALALQNNLAFVNLFKVPPQAHLLKQNHIHEYLQHQAVPWRSDLGCVTIACVKPSDRVKRWATARFGKVRFVMTAPRDIYISLETHFGAALEREARTSLLRDLPLISAHYGASLKQRIGFLFALTAFCVLVYAAARSALTITLLFINLIYAVHLAFKGFLFLAGLKLMLKKKTPITLTLKDEELPIYTILIPLYDEARSIPHLIEALEDLDYPTEKLDIKMILEAGDENTLNAIKAHKPPAHFHVLKVPDEGTLRTKPRACNYALSYARGSIVTIYDAEDRPPPDQLRKTVQLFHDDPKIACIQAKLNFYNRKEHWLARLFSIEYSQLFDSYLPALESLNMPIPLGGTSNHMHLSRLRKIGAWDPYNVTEDADLGMRLALLGQRTIILDSTTMEEAPITVLGWLNQRSRWIKGHMQTWLVYMRQPITLYRALGPRGFWGLQMFVGTPSLVYLTAPIMWSVGILWGVGIITDGIIPAWMLVVNLLILIAGFAGHIWQALITIRFQGWDNMLGAALTYPLYWFLHSIASFKSLYQLIFRPHYWEKTSHGHSKHANFRW